MPSVQLTNRAIIRVTGEDAEHFLHNLVTTDIEAMPEGEWWPGALLSAQGKVQDAFLVARHEDGFIMECSSIDSADFHKRLKFYRLRAKVDLSEPINVQPVVIWGASAPDGAMRDARFGLTLVWHTANRLHGNVDNQASWIALRIEHAVAEAHDDYDYGDVFPHDVNLDQINGVSFKKGCYVGQEVVSRMQHRGTARRRLMIAEADTELAGGTELFGNSKPVGRIGSVSGVHALALVRLDRVREAMDANVPILAGHLPVRLQFPHNVTYSWPQPAQVA